MQLTASCVIKCLLYYAKCEDITLQSILLKVLLFFLLAEFLRFSLYIPITPCWWSLFKSINVSSKGSRRRNQWIGYTGCVNTIDWFSNTGHCPLKIISPSSVLFKSFKLPRSLVAQLFFVCVKELEIELNIIRVDDVVWDRNLCPNCSLNP